MSTRVVRKLDGGTATLSSANIESLRANLRGPVCLPGEPGYDAARSIWNAMIDRHPALVVRAENAADVAQTVRFARDEGFLLAVRAGGHNIAGNAVHEDVLLLDLSTMRSVRVDSKTRTARVEPGATLADLDRATQEFGLAVPVGINSTTGVAGLTLGGGFGWLSRKYGLTIDNLRSADVVTASGELVHASTQENPDLFWAVRGGGGNFGVVTAFEFQLHPIGTEVLSGLVIHPFADAKNLLESYRSFARSAPDELTCWVVLRKAPPLPFLPAEVHGKEVLIFAACWCGDAAKGQEALAPLRALGKPIADVIGPHPYVGWQAAFDPLLTPGARNYWKSHDFTTLGDGVIAATIDFVGRLPSPDCEIFIAQLGGAINRVPADATAYPHRNIDYVMNVHTRWSDPSQDQKCIDWARAFFDAAAPFASGGVYVNFMPEDETQRVQSGAYGPNYARLAKLKAKYDPDNFFRLNQNIRPAN